MPTTNPRTLTAGELLADLKRADTAERASRMLVVLHWCRYFEGHVGTINLHTGVITWRKD